MLLKSGSLNNVGSGNKSSGRIPRGNKLVRLVFDLSGTAPEADTDIDEIRLSCNTKEICRLSGAQLISMMTAMGLTVDKSQVALQFGDVRGLNTPSVFTGGIDTAKGVTSLDLAVDFAAAAPADIGCTPYIDVIPPERDAAGAPVGLGYITSYRRHVIPATAATIYPLEPAFGSQTPGEKVKRLFVFGDNVAGVGVKKNGNFVHEDIPQAVNDQDNADWGLTAVPGLYLLDFVKRGEMREGLSKGADTSSMEYRIETNGAGTVTIIEEVLTRLEWL